MGAIKPTDVKLSIEESKIESAFEFINNKLLRLAFHDQHIKVENYHAIILTPYGSYIDVMDEVVKEYKSIGWDCFWSLAYDGRGPHYCFYVHEKHFKL